MTLSVRFSDGERRGTKQFGLTYVITTAPPLYAGSRSAPALSPSSCSCFVSSDAKVH